MKLIWILGNIIKAAFLGHNRNGHFRSAVSLTTILVQIILLSLKISLKLKYVKSFVLIDKIFETSCILVLHFFSPAEIGFPSYFSQTCLNAFLALTIGAEGKMSCRELERYVWLACCREWHLAYSFNSLFFRHSI